MAGPEGGAVALAVLVAAAVTYQATLAIGRGRTLAVCACVGVGAEREFGKASDLAELRRHVLLVHLLSPLQFLFGPEQDCRTCRAYGANTRCSINIGRFSGFAVLNIRMHSYKWHESQYDLFFSMPKISCRRVGPS